MSKSAIDSQRPFWLVTRVSGGLAVLTLAMLLVLYGVARHTQYLVLAGLVGLILIAHVAAWRLARARGRYDVGIWLIAAAQVFSAITAPLVIADYWIIGVPLMLVLPIEIGVADHLKRVPLFLVAGLLGAAGMVAVDLVAVADRLTILVDVPITAFLAVGFLILHITGLTILLWRLRLRPSSAYHIQIDLATQQSLTFAIISAASVIVVFTVLIAQIRESQIAQVGQNFQTLAEINAERVGNTLDQQINALLALGRRETVLLDGLAAANAAYPASDADARRLIEEREHLWQTSPETSDFVLTYRSNPQTIELSKFRGNDLLHNNVFLTDRYGALVAAQGEKPVRFDYGDQAWWQAAWNNGLGGMYVGQLKIDLDTKIATVFLAVEVLNPQTNQTIGVLASTYQLRGIQRDMDLAQHRIVAEIRLLAPDGIEIASPSQPAIGQPTWPSLYTSGILPGGAEPPRALVSGWQLGDDRYGNPAVVAHAPLNTTAQANLDALRGLGWQVVVSDTQENALAEVTRSIQVASLVGLIVMAVVVLAAIATSRVLTRPINALTTTAALITGGDLDRRAEPVGPVELVTLAQALNTLTARQRSLINSLQDQVAQRTAQLAARAEELETINRIGQSLASQLELSALIELVGEEIRETFNAQLVYVALYDRATHLIHFPYDYDGGAWLESESIRFGEGLVSCVIASRQPLLINHDLEQRLIELGVENIGSLARSYLGVPILSGDEAIGAISVQSTARENMFSDADVRLLTTIAASVGVAIQNARLFEETQKAKEAAEEANAAKSTFLANVSHELRTPLTSVLGFAKIIRKRLQDVILPVVPGDDPRVQRAIQQVGSNIDIIVSEGERLTELINNVLDLAKIEAGKLEWAAQPVAIAEVIEQAASATESLFAGKSLALVEEVAPGLPAIIGDHHRLVQVVINLISNAVKFTERGSVTCRAEQVNGDIIVRVIDTGIGIAAADLPKVFEEFVQVGSALTGKPQGTGLGLAISKQIVEHHGGRLWVDSRLHAGSAFSFALPIGVLAQA